MKLQNLCRLLGKVYYKTIVSHFGEEILLSDGTLDRKKLAKYVFTDSSKKEKLDKLTKCYVVPRIKKYAKVLETEVSVIDAALLFEMGLNDFCDITIGVISNKDTCIKRICKRDNIDESIAKSRIESQKQNDFFKSNCSYVINNEENENLEKDILDIFNRKKSI